jgi:hypothetical protein
MNAIVRPFVLVAAVCSLAGCATTSDPYGSPRLAWLDVCTPYGLSIDWPPADVPDLLARDRRDLPPRVASAPDLRPLRDTLDLGPSIGDLPVLLARERPAIADRPVDVPELPPSRGAPSLPATSRDVPTLLPYDRPQIPAGPALPLDLAASSRALELGVRYGPPLVDLRTCQPALAFALSPCRLSARADRELAWPNP